MNRKCDGVIDYNDNLYILLDFFFWYTYKFFFPFPSNKLLTRLNMTMYTLYLLSHTFTNNF